MKRRRGIDLSEAEVATMLHEVAAAKAHIASHGSKTDAFKAVADVLNGNIYFVSHMDAKNVLGRFGR